MMYQKTILIYLCLNTCTAARLTADRQLSLNIPSVQNTRFAK